MENDLIFIDVEKRMHTADGPMNLKVQSSIQSGELVALFGQSGAGKTTLLRILAGLINPDQGVVKYGNTVWFDSEKQINVVPQLRNISLMFQDFALFPNMTVEQNIRFAQPVKNEALNEVFRLATQVICLEKGIVTRIGTPEDVFLDTSISGKVQITGQIARIDKQDTIYIVTVISGNNQIIKVIAFDSDLEHLTIGDRVMVFSKAFNPIISKLK